jgi:hypothetical protein
MFSTLRPLPYAEQTGWRRFLGPSRRVRLLLGLGTAALFLLAVAWILVTGLLARSQAGAAQAAVNTLRADLRAADLSTVGSTTNEVRSHSRRAHQLTSGPAWWIGAHIPWIGSPLASARGMAEQADTLAGDVLAPLVGVSERLDVGHLVDHGKITIEPLAQAAPTVRLATEKLRSTQAGVAALPTSTWLPTVDRAREHLLSSLDKLQGQLDSANRAVSILPDMLGATRPQRYFVGLENESESRGLGGIPGEFAIVTADNGQLDFSRFASDTALMKTRTGLDLGTEFARRYGALHPTQTYANSTVSPDFRDAARIWAAMWQKYSGQHIDGAIAIEPTAISYLLRVTGPAQLADGSQITASNVVPLTQKSLYRTYPDISQRKNHLLQIATAISTRLLAAKGSTALINAAGRAAEERRLMIWSAYAQTESVLRQTTLAGTIEPGDRPFAGFTTDNATGGKLDYYLRRTLGYQRTGCGSASQTVTTIGLHNDVPPGSLPPYVTLRQDHPGYPTAPGDNKILLNVYATGGTTIQSVTVDGIRTTGIVSSERGLTVVTIPVELKRGATRSVVVTAHEPPRYGTVQLLKQPSVQPLALTGITETSCG